MNNDMFKNSRRELNKTENEFFEIDDNAKNYDFWEEKVEEFVDRIHNQILDNENECDVPTVSYMKLSNRMRKAGFSERKMHHAINYARLNEDRERVWRSGGVWPIDSPGYPIGF